MSEHSPRYTSKSIKKNDQSTGGESVWTQDLTEDKKKQHPRSREVLLLGGGDAEMMFVERAARRLGVTALNNAESWEGADIDAYSQDIEQILESGMTPVAIELRNATNNPDVVDIDHHNEKSDRPSSLLQVLERFGVQASLAEQLVAANDSAYIPGMEQVLEQHIDTMRKKGFSDEALEASRRRIVKMMNIVRRIDRREQGVTEEMEQEAEAALANVEEGPNGLRIVRLNGDRPSPVTDRMFGTWPEGRQNLIVICSSAKGEQEVWYFGNGQEAKTAKEHFLAKKQERTDNTEKSQSNEYHAWGGGTGFGEADKDAFCGIVTTNPDEAVDYIKSLQA